MDDVFRFHLLPELISSDLPQITKSVLKTRSTLGLNKVYKYLFRRLLTLKVDDLIRNDNDPQIELEPNLDAIIPEEKIEILCNGKYLKPTLQLKDVKEIYWQGPFDNPNHNSDLLILHYRRKFSKQEKLAIEYDKKYTRREKVLVKPQIMVPNHLSLEC